MNDKLFIKKEKLVSFFTLDKRHLVPQVWPYFSELEFPYHDVDLGDRPSKCVSISASTNANVKTVAFSVETGSGNYTVIDFRLFSSLLKKRFC